MLYARRGAVAGRPAPATVFTIHNLAFQGLQPRALIDELLPQLGKVVWSQTSYCRNSRNANGEKS